jgi:hypothetical protein
MLDDETNPKMRRGTAGHDALMSDMVMPFGQYDMRVGYWATWKVTLTYLLNLFIY